jgi:hypothetical protein
MLQLKLRPAKEKPEIRTLKIALRSSGQAGCGTRSPKHKSKTTAPASESGRCTGWAALDVFVFGWGFQDFDFVG